MESVYHFLREEGTDKYKKAKDLSEVESKNDPENEPYKSKYKAREICQDLKSSLQSLGEDLDSSQDGTVRYKAIISGLELVIAINYADTDETTTAEEKMAKILEDLDELKLNKFGCGVYCNALNQLGILWTGRRNESTALEYLQKSEKLYNDFKHEVGATPYTLDELFEVPEQDADEGALERSRSESFEAMHTHTLYYLAQVYGRMEESELSAKYCHVTLRRQLETMKYNPVEWALNAATLSQFYLTTNKNKMARHCLASASMIVQEAGPPPDQTPSENEGQAEIDAREEIPRALADINRCWAKYGLGLLEVSREKLLAEVSNDESHNEDKMKDETNKTEECSSTSREGRDEQDDKETFFDLELTIHEEKITDQYPLDFEQARAIFLCVQRWLNSAKNYYSLDGHCTDYVEIVQDYSKAYKLLAFYEMDFERQCKMHKRRVDMLLELHKELNPQFYLLICRQIIYELAETYSGMLDLKLAIIEDGGGNPTVHNIKKINLLAEQSITQYIAYIDSLRDAKKELPEQFSDDDERPVLVAHFCVGRLYSKFLVPEVSKRLALTKKSLDYYKFVVDYCKKNPSATDKMKQERDICEEMVQLLPAKMERMRAQSEN